MSGKNIKLKNSQQVTASTTPVNILESIVGLRDSLMLQNQGDDQIKIYFTESDKDNDVGYLLNSMEWVVFDTEKLQNAIWVKAVATDCVVVYQANSARK